MKHFIASLFMACCGLALAQSAPSTNIPQMPNAVTICPEGCTITSISPAAVLQVGTNTAPGGWGPTFSNPTLPLLVSYGTAQVSASLPPADPLTGVAKEIDAQMMAAPYTVAWTDAAGAAHTTPVAALPPPPPPPPTPTATASLAALLQLMLPSSTPGTTPVLVITCDPRAPMPPPPPTLPAYGIQLPCALSIDLVGIGPNYQPLPPATAAAPSK